MFKKIVSVLVSTICFTSLVLAETDYKARGEIDSIRHGKNNSDQIDILRVRTSVLLPDAAIAAADVAITAGYMLIGQTGGIGASKAMSGDVKIDTNGVASLQANSVVSTNITDGAIVNADVNASAAIAGSKLNLTSGVTDVKVGGDLTVEEGGTLLSASMVKLSDELVYMPLSITVTNGYIYGASARTSFHITSTAVPESTNTVANPGETGQLVKFVNVSTNPVTFAKAANLALGDATRVLGQYDQLTLYSISGTVWIEDGFVNNTLGP